MSRPSPSSSTARHRNTRSRALPQTISPRRQRGDCGSLRWRRLAAIFRPNFTVKARIVSRDPFERGERAHLNLGHTFGHAIETMPSLELLHGEAVAIGLVGACRTAVALGRLSPAASDRVVRLLSALQLPTQLTAPVQAAEARRRMGFDKKVAGGALRLVLPSAIGQVEVVQGVDEDAITAGLASIGAR